MTAKPSEDCFSWTWDGERHDLGTTRLGSGRTALLLPALSSISTRREMAPLAERLAQHFETVAVDWPGFGAAPKPAMAWNPAAYSEVLRRLVEDLAPVLVVAAGHAAGYLLAEAAARPRPDRRLGLVAPTWRGPLPTMLGRRPPWLAAIARAADRPLLGQALYRVNVNPAMVGVMPRAHVYDDPTMLAGRLAADKRAVTNAPGARHAAVRFVTGALDPFRDRAGFLACAATLQEPTLVLFGAATPPKSRAEMEALAALPNLASRRLPRGKLSLHEEYPEAVASDILAFCGPR